MIGMNERPDWIKRLIEDMVADGTFLRMPDGKLVQNLQRVAENRARYGLDWPDNPYAGSTRH